MQSDLNEELRQNYREESRQRKIQREKEEFSENFESMIASVSSTAVQLGDSDYGQGENAARALVESVNAIIDQVKEGVYVPDSMHLFYVRSDSYANIIHRYAASYEYVISSMTAYERESLMYLDYILTHREPPWLADLLCSTEELRRSLESSNHSPYAQFFTSIEHEFSKIVNLKRLIHCCAYPADLPAG